MVRKFVYDPTRGRVSALHEFAGRPATRVRGIRVTWVFAAIAATLLGFGIAAAGDSPPPASARP